MHSDRSAFEKVLFERLIPEFCDDPKRCCERSGFRSESMQISPTDAEDFLRAFRSELIEHQGRGLYRAPASAVCEQFFWEGRKSLRPRPFTLWLEPIITIAGLARLHFDHSWPRESMGTQSSDWAFDLVAYLPGQTSEFIACEVKKSAKEIEGLVRLMKLFAHDPSLRPPASGKERNAFKKVVGLRSRQPPVFWALGPAGISHVFEVVYKPGDDFELVPRTEAALAYPYA